MRYMPDDPDLGAVTELTLVIPAANDHIQFARLMASAVGTRAGLDYDTIEDLRIAVSELCTSVTEGVTSAGDLTLTYRGDATGVHIVGRAPLAPGSAAPVPPSELTRQILDAVAGGHTFELGPAEVRFTLVMRATASPAR